MQPKLRIAPAEGINVDARRPRHLLEESGCPFEYRRGPRQASACELRREYRITPGFGRREPFPVRQDADPGQSKRNMIVDCKADGVAELLRVKFHQPSSGERHGGKAEQRR